MTAVAQHQPLAFASAYRQLRPSEKAFVDSYVASVEREAIRANERISNALYRPVPQAVREASQGMFDRPLVVAAITERISAIARDSELTPERVIKEITSIAFANMGDYGRVGEDGSWSWDLSGCTPEQMAAVKGIKVEMDPRNPYVVRKMEIALHDKLSALKDLMTYMGLTKEDNPHWRNDVARPVQQAVTTNATVEQAGDMYARMING